MGEVVINKASELFFTYGLKSTSMDDLARRAGISKKTIYQSVGDKNEVVGKVVEELIRCHNAALLQSSRGAKDAIQELLSQASLPFATLATINVNFFYELEKFFPAEWKKLMQHKQSAVQPAIIKNLVRGISEGVYREELDLAFVAAVRLQQIATALNPIGFSEKRSVPQKLMTELTLFYLHSIVTTKGKKLINKYRSQHNES